jgi:hypothetical protein
MTEASSKSFRFKAFVFLLVNVMAGGLHYLFQLIAARRLSPAEFGEFSGWYAWVCFGLSFGALAQYGANFFPARPKALKLSMLSASVMALIVLGYFFLSGRVNELGLGLLSIAIAPFATWLLGQAQRRMLLMTFSFGGLVIGAAKVLTVLIVNPAHEGADMFYWGLALSYVAGIAFLVVLLVLNFKSSVSPEAAKSGIGGRLSGAVLLSFSSVFIPNIDLIYVQSTQTSEALTRFAQVSLFYKAVFFIILIMAQWLLPHQLNRGASKALNPRRMKVFVRICSMGMVFSMGASVLAEPFYRIALGKEFLASTLWVFMACFNVSLLTGIFLEIQNQIAASRVKDAAVCLLAQVLTVAGAYLFGLDLSTYLQIQIGVNGILLFLLILGAGRIFAGQMVEQGRDGVASAGLIHK